MTSDTSGGNAIDDDKLPNSMEAGASNANSKRRQSRKRKRKRRGRKSGMEKPPGMMTSDASGEIAIQDFNGEGDGTLSGIRSAIEFCNTIDAARGLNGWTDEVTAYVAKYHTKGAALTWLTNLGDERSKRWPVLRAALLQGGNSIDILDLWQLFVRFCAIFWSGIEL